MKALYNRYVLILVVVVSACLPSLLMAKERVYFTGSTKPGAGDSQLYSMDEDGKVIQRHTSTNGIKWGVYRCQHNDQIYYSSDDALALLNKDGGEEILAQKNDVQYHSPRCSSDGRYLSVTAWDKTRQIGFIEVYDQATKKEIARWEGEFASWMMGKNVIIYRVCRRSADGDRVLVYVRNLNSAAEPPKIVYSLDIGDGIYDLSEPQIVGPTSRDFVFRIFDEHEYLYYYKGMKQTFILTRNKKTFEHYDFHRFKKYVSPVEEAQLTLSPDSKYAVINENKWNTPPSLILIDMKTRDSWKIADGFNPVWSKDSRKIFFNKDPSFYERSFATAGDNEQGRKVYPKSLDGYEIYRYDLEQKKETRLTHDNLYQGFL